jgi:diaminopimelate decarboxylase
MDRTFTYTDGHLHAGSIRLSDLAREYGTPLYVYHRPGIQARIEAVRSAFSSSPFKLCYSVKANPILSLLRWLAGFDVGFDVVSGGELRRLLHVDVPADRIIFAGVGKTEQELRLAIEQRIWMITAESIGEIDRIEALAADAGRSDVAIALRINPNVDARTHEYMTTGRSVDKFGILHHHLERALEEVDASAHLCLIGLHMHLGSQITSTDPYVRGLRVLLEWLEEARNRGNEVTWLNAGGGFGIPHGEDLVPAPTDYADAILPLLEEAGVELLLELGRYLVGPAGVLLTEIQYVKEREDGALAITDAGMAEFLRPALYGAEHQVLLLDERSSEDLQPTIVAGPICESSDVLVDNGQFPPLKPSQLLAIMDAGAYGSTMASNYNSHLRPAEVWITETDDVAVIRDRESIENLLMLEEE